MQSTSKCASVLSVALAFGLVLVIGCAAPPESEGAAAAAAVEGEAAQAVAMTADEIEAALADADDLYQSDQFEAARDIYAALAEQGAALSEEQADHVETQIGPIDSIMHERSLAAAEPMAQEAEEPVAEEPQPAPEMTPAGAEELLAEVKRLCAERELIQAAGLFETLDPIRDMLPPAGKLDYDQLRMDFQAETGQLPVLTEDQKEDRAEEQLDYGVEAYDQGRLLAAQKHLMMARAFDVSIGWLDNRKLRKTLERVNDRILQAQDDYVAARNAFEYAGADEAEALLAALAAEPAGLDEDQVASVDQMLKAIREEKAEATAEAGMMEEEAAEAPAEEMAAEEAPAEEMAAEEAAEEAAMEAPAEEMAAEEAPAEEMAAEEAPAEEMAAEEMMEEAPAEDPEDVAQALFDEGIEAYEDGRYADALLKLDQAAALNVSIGWMDNRQLRKVRAELSEVVPELVAGYEAGAELFEAGEYEQAVAALEPVVDRRVNFGDPQTAEAAELLAAAREKLAAEQQQELQMRAERAGEILARARTLAGQGDYMGAQAALADLGDYNDVLIARQREAVAALTQQVQSAAEVVSVEQKLAEAQKLAAEAQELLSVQREVQAKLREADAAVSREDYVTAQARLTEAQQMLADVDTTAIPALAAVGETVAARMESVSAAAARQAHEQEVRRRINGLLDDATDTAQTDLLAAEKKVLQAKQLAETEGVDMTVAQIERSNAVLAMVEAEYGVERRLRPATYARLDDLAAALLAAGEPAKAAQLLALVEGAPEEMVSAAAREEAMGALPAARQAAEAQRDAAAACQTTLAEAGASLEGGELAEALDRSSTAVSKAREAVLSGAPLVTVLEAAATFLEEDFARAAAQARPEQREVIDQLVGKARAAEAFGASRFYLNNGSPSLAKPYLQVLLDSPYATAEVKATARQAMGSMQVLQAQAEQELLLAVAPEADVVHSLAMRLNSAVKAGNLAEAGDLEVALADAEVALASARAEALIDRGAYSAAAAALEEAPAGSASASARAMHIEPLQRRLQSLRAMATSLLAAEKALAAYNVDAAQEKLTAARAAGADSELLAMKLEVLGAAVDQVRATQEMHVALTARRDEQLGAVKDRLAVAAAQQQVWESFFEALSAFLAGEEGGNAAIREVAADPSGLPPGAAALAAEVAGELTEWESRPAAAEAQRVLAAAKRSFAAADYVAAAALLRQLRGMPGAADPAVAAESEALGGRISATEARAAALYEEAAAALKAGDADGVRAALTELKSKYANTQTYREHM